MQGLLPSRTTESLTSYASKVPLHGSLTEQSCPRTDAHPFPVKSPDCLEAIIVPCRKSLESLAPYAAWVNNCKMRRHHLAVIETVCVGREITACTRGDAKPRLRAAYVLLHGIMRTGS